MSALIKVDEKGQNEQKKYMQIFKSGTNFWENEQCVCKIFKTAKKRPFSLATPQLDQAKDQSITLLWIDAQIHSSLPWCHLSSLT